MLEWTRGYGHEVTLRRPALKDSRKLEIRLHLWLVLARVRN